MRLTSLNLRGFVELDERLPRIAEHVAAESPDVLLLQEVVFLPEVSPVSNARLVQERIGFPYRHESITRLQRGREQTVYREGLAILSRLPVDATEALVLHHDPRDPHQRIVQFADVLAADGVWPFGNVHLSIRDDFAIQHLKEILEVMRAAKQPRILAGDFNVNRLERHRRLWGDWTISTQIDHYLSRPASNETDDYVLAPPTFRITAVRLSGDGLSDHRAVTVDLERVG